MATNGTANGSHCCTGPGYATPLDATKGPREKLLYIPCIIPDHSRPDYVATVDVDPASSEFGKVIHRTHLKEAGDEPHHSGWNSCSSCFGDNTKQRKFLVLPCLGRPRVYGIDVATNPRAPTVAHIVEPEEIEQKTGLSYLHTSHCLGSGEIMVCKHTTFRHRATQSTQISAMGDPDGNAKGGFVLLDGDFKVKGTWSKQSTDFGYDFWYQPKHNILVSSSWGAPKAFTKGFDPSLVSTKYGDKLYFWDWTTRELIQTISLGAEGLIPLEIRFKHDPNSTHGYVGAALSSNVIHFTKDPANPGKWKHSVVIKQPWVDVDGWVLPQLPPLITDILISLDDKYIYFSNWLRGDIVQYDISDPENPKLAGRVWVGGVIKKVPGDRKWISTGFQLPPQGSSVKPTGNLPDGLTEAPSVPTVKGHTLEGGPQMLQLSLDGKRLYVTNSLFSPWDKQFYPDLAKKGSYLLQIDVDNVHGGLKINPEFFIDFGAEPYGPVLAHEVRYPGGDCSSDIWL